MPWFKQKIAQFRHSGDPQLSADAPPAWTPTVGESLQDGLLSDAPEAEFEDAEKFCRAHPAQPPTLLASTDVEAIKQEGCSAWEIAQPSRELTHPSHGSRFQGQVEVLHSQLAVTKVTRVITTKNCGDVCLMSNWPIIAGLYDIGDKTGVYYEVTVVKMKGTIAVGKLAELYSGIYK